MTTTPDETFAALEPDFAIPPGDTLRDRLEFLGMTQAELATRTGLSPKHINQVLNGVAHLSPEVAQKLELATGVPARLWNRLEADYRSTLMRLQQRREVSEDYAWLKGLPISELVRRHALPAEPSDKASRVQQLLAFFGVASPDAWSRLWLSPTAAFRQSPTFVADPGAVATWLRLGELKAQLVQCAPFDANALRAALERMRSWTVQTPDEYAPALKRLCADCGVALVFVSEIKGARVSGATRWVTPSRAVVQLSGRYGTDDHLWFTLFHELGHVLLHSKRGIFIDDDEAGADAPAEREADQFAQEQLIPADRTADYRALPPRVGDIVAFAREIGIAPGVVIGRLQREGRLPHNIGNQFKQRIHVADA